MNKGYKLNNKSSKSDRVAYIDGIRAIAVIAVLAYHFQIDEFTQGFFGVDVFFVISGYVVSRSLFASMRNEHIGIMHYVEHFYRRRFWRLMPALAATIVVTLCLAYFFVPPAYLSSQIFFTAVAAAGGIANISLMLGANANYFDQMASYNLFLHTWSLGVEEQFYLIVPILFWIFFRSTSHRRVGIVVFAFLALISLVLAAWWSSTYPAVAFYSLPSRFWELAAGAITYLALSVSPLRAGNRTRAYVVGGWIGFALVLISFIIPFEMSSPFPAAILPVAGTIILIACGTYEPAQSLGPYRWLSYGFASYLGRISYSLYLWHWPVAALLRWTYGFKEPWQISLAFFISFLLAICSYHFIERPFQTMSISRVQLRPVALISAFLAISCYSLVVLFVGNARDFSLRMPSRSIVSHQFGWEALELPTIGLQRPEDLYGKRPALIVVGDSHALSIAGAAIAAAREASLGIGIVSTDCGFKLTAPLPERPACASVFNALDRAKAGDIVMFAALNVPRFVDQDGTRLPDPDFGAENITSARKKASDQFADAVAKLRAKHVGVIIRNPEPLFRFIPFRCSDWFNQMNPICQESTTVPRSELMVRAKPAMDSIAAVARSIPGIVVLNVFDVLCPQNTCSIYNDKRQPLFRDQDHLSGWGNEIILPELNKSIAEAQESLRPTNAE